MLLKSMLIMPLCLLSCSPVLPLPIIASISFVLFCLLPHHVLSNVACLNFGHVVLQPHHVCLKVAWLNQDCAV